MVNLVVLYGLSAALCWGSADFLSRRQSERVGSYRTVLYVHVMTLVIIGALLPVLGADYRPSPEVSAVLVAGGLLSFLAFILLYRAFRVGSVSVVAPIAYTYPAITSILSIVLLGTILPAVSWIAIAGVIAGVVLLSSKASQLRRLTAGATAVSARAGVGSAIGASLCFGVVYVGVGYSIPLVGYVLPVFLLRAVAAAVGFLLAPALKENPRPSRAVLSNTIVVMGALESVGFLAFGYGVSQAGSSLPVVTAVSGMGGAVAAAYGFIFLKERLEANQITGVVLAILGVFTLLYFGG